MRRFQGIAFVLVLLASEGCSEPALRPSSVPGTASFTGGPSGGSWIDCGPEASGIRECQIFYGTTGRVQESGTYRSIASVENCHPSFLVSDYRVGDGFLMPVVAMKSSGRLWLSSVESGENLESAISQRYEKLTGLAPSSVTIEYENDCRDGAYSAAFPDRVVNGNIWAGEIFQVWRR